MNQKHTVLKTLIPLLVSAGLTACGGGGGGESAITAPATKSVSDDYIALRIALTMMGNTAASSSESRTRGDVLSSWSFASESVSIPCGNGIAAEQVQSILTNADTLPSVGDSEEWTALCTWGHGSAVPRPRLTTSQNTGKITLAEVSSTNFDRDKAWSIAEEHVKTNNYRYDPILVGGAAILQGTTTTKLTTSYRITHLADDSETQSASTSATLTHSDPIGTMDLLRNTQYSCKYAIGKVDNPDCSEGTATASGTLYGVAINATMTSVAGQPWTYDIVDGNAKTRIKNLSFSPTRQINDSFLITLPSGKTVTVTGEDINWVSGL